MVSENKLTVRSDGGRGMDHWTDGAVQDQIDRLRRDIELMEHEQREAKQNLQRHYDALADAEAEITERFQEAERAAEADFDLTCLIASLTESEVDELLANDSIGGC